MCLPGALKVVFIIVKELFKWLNGSINPLSRALLRAKNPPRLKLRWTKCKVRKGIWNISKSVYTFFKIKIQKSKVKNAREVLSHAPDFAQGEYLMKVQILLYDLNSYVIKLFACVV